MQQQQQQGHNAQQSPSNIQSIQSIGSNEVNRWWPVFGKKTAASTNTFWSKNSARMSIEEFERLTPSTTLNSEQANTQLLIRIDSHDDREQNYSASSSHQQLQHHGGGGGGSNPNRKGSQTGSTNHVHVQPILKLNRISKKSKLSKEYVYRVIKGGEHLVYYREAETASPVGATVFKGSMKLCSDVVIEKKSLQGKTGQISYIEFLKEGNVRKLYSKDHSLVGHLFDQIRRKCVLSNFKEHYKKLEILGSGSFASVFKVIRYSDNKVFAAKIIKQEKLEENKHKEKFVTMLLNEYRVLSEANHKNITKMEEIYQDDDQLVYIMEYLVGGEIYSRLRSLRRFTEEVAAEILRNLAHGLQHIHNMKVVHRDLKLENILFVSKTENECKLIDFGFAEKINYEKLESRAGTPGFLPPELFKLGPYTEKGDIFSLGVILYCLISGNSPFKGRTYKDVLENNRKCLITFDSTNWSKVSEECKYLIRRMVEVDPRRRYSCTDILRSKWMNKYFPEERILWSSKSLNTTKKTAANNSQKDTNNSNQSRTSFAEDDKKSSNSRASGDESVDFNTSTMINMHSDTPKSLYRKSMRSLKSLKSMKSHFSQRKSSKGSNDSGAHPQDDEEADEDAQEKEYGPVQVQVQPEKQQENQLKLNELQSYENLSAPNSAADVNLCDVYKGKLFENNVATFKQCINSFIDENVDVSDVDDDADMFSLSQKLLSLFTPNKKFIHPLTLAASQSYRLRTRI